MKGTLGTRMAQRDEAAFVGRREELAVFDGLFVEDPPASVVFVHGPGGIGKSTLLREIARRGEQRGWRPHFVEGRDLAPVPDALEDAVSPARADERPLIVFDTYERMAAVGGYLRRGLLPSLPQRTLVVIASRRAPEPAWFEGGWESLVREVKLGALSDPDSMELLRAHDLTDEATARQVVHWAEGSPLALALAAGAAAADPAWRPEAPLDHPELVRMLIRRLIEAELDAAHVGALGVAAIARVTTVELLRAVLPDSDPEEAYRWLESRTFSEPLGDGVTLHELVRRAVRADLRRRDAERERDMRRRIADHHYSQAVEGRLLASIDLAHLIESPAIRWGFSWEGSLRHRIDDVRAGDAETVGRLLCQIGHQEWWETTRLFFEDAAEHVAVARDADDRLCGYTVYATPASAPDFSDRDPLLGPWLDHARRNAPEGSAVLFHDSIDFTLDPESHVQAMLGLGGILRSGLSNPRWAYLPLNPTLREAYRFAEALGARHLPDLDLDVSGLRIECHLVDYGPGGLLGAQRDWVYRELGLVPPKPADATDGAEAARQALKSLRLPHVLAANPLAEGGTVEERATSVRALMEEAAAAAFGETENERLLHRVLMRGYIDPAPSHERAAEELIMSRATYFRRLRAATERVAEYVAARGDG